MPAEAATAQMPWASAYTDLPGLEQMRAVYRWFGGTRLMLILLAGVGVAALARRPRHGPALAAAAVALVMLDTAPNVPGFIEAHQQQRRQQVAMRADLRDPLVAALRPGERVFFAGAGANANPFLVNSIAASAKVRSYSVGGDKNLAVAQARWPAQVIAMAGPGAGGPEAVARALATRTVDVVVLPYADLRWATERWPPPPQEREASLAAFAPLLSDPRFEVERGRWFATLRRPGTPPV